MTSTPPASDGFLTPKRALRAPRRPGRLSTRLLAILILLGAFAAVPALIAYSALDSAEEADREQLRYQEMMSAASAIKDSILIMQSNGRGYVISGRSRHLDAWRQGRNAIRRQTARLRRIVPEDGELQAAAREVEESVEAYVDGYATPLIRIAIRNRDAAAKHISRRAARSFSEPVRAELDQLVDLFGQVVADARERAESYSDRAQLVLIIGVVGGLIVALLSWLYVLRTVRRPLLELTDVVARFGQDDFAARGDPAGPYEIEFLIRSFNEMAAQREQARHQVMSASEAKSEFLARMSHELRTPLNAILGFGQLLEMDGVEAEQAESVDQILRAGRHLLSLIDEVLDISKIESGRLRISLEPVAMKGVIADVQSMIGPLAAERKVSVEATLDDDSRYALADQQRLKQILLNLLTNAINYNRPGGDVKLYCSGDGSMIRIAVSDTGIGIDAAMTDRLFTPFERLGAERSGEVEGTGLGLALSQRLAELMSGNLELKESGSDGSTFMLTLPEIESPEAVQESEGEPVRRQRDRDDLVVVYIEDNVSNFSLVEQIFERHLPARLYTSIQGSIGIELVRRHKPDIVLLDLHLPDMTGETVLNELKTDAETAGIPVIVISADATSGHQRRLIEQGADEYLTKPLDVPRFIETVRRATSLEGAEIDVAD